MFPQNHSAARRPLVRRSVGAGQGAFMREDDFEGTSRPSQTGIWGRCLQVLDLSALGVARQNMRITLRELLAQLDL